jgi:PAS domain S-box-containing protein
MSVPPNAPPSPEFLASVVEHSDDAIITKDLNGCVTSWNKSAERIFGYTAEEMLGKPISIIAAPDRLDEMPRILQRVRSGERIEHFQTVRKAKDGRLIDISLTVSPVKDADGRIIGASKIARDITENVRAAARLAELNDALQKSAAETRQTRDWLETMLISIGDAVIATDRHGKVTLLNAVAESLTGWRRDDAIGKPLGEVFAIASEERGVKAGNPGARMLVEGRITAAAGHTELIARDGRRIAIDDSAAPIRDADGATLGAVLVFRDVSEKRAAEERLKNQAFQLAQELSATRRLHELGTRLITTMDWRLLLGEILAAAESITGADMGTIQLIEVDGSLRINAQDGFQEEFLKLLDAVQADGAGSNGKPFLPDARLIVEDLERTELLSGSPKLKALRAAGVRAVQSTPMISHGGAVVGVLSTHYKQPRQPSERDLRLIDLLARQAADLIQRIRVEDQLRTTERQLVTITDNMAAAVSRCSRDFRYLWVSPAYAAWLGIPKDEIAGRPIPEVIGERAHKQLLPYMERVLGGERVEFTAQVNFFSAGERWIHTICIPTLSPDSTVDGWTTVVTDITESRQNEDRLIRANADLARANDDLNQFAFAASHDLQEPLRMITSYSQLLQKGYRGKLDDDAATYMEFITEGAERMRTLLTDLLAYTQLSISGEEEQASAPVDLNEVFQKTLENCKVAIEETNAIVTCGLLPATIGHETHFIQLFQNLIGNALKYRSDVQPRVHVSVDREHAFWRFAVADNGVGIAPEYHKQIFGVFKRLHGKAIAGTGIGLAICQRVAERYGGKIWVTSEAGQGATFYFTLPAAEGANEQRALSTPAHGGQGG